MFIVISLANVLKDICRQYYSNTSRRCCIKDTWIQVTNATLD